MDESSYISLIVSAGLEVAALVNKKQNAVTYQVEFSFTGTGRDFSSGVYSYKLETRNGQAEGFTDTKRMVLVK